MPCPEKDSFNQKGSGQACLIPHLEVAGNGKRAAEGRKAGSQPPHTPTPHTA